MREMGGFMAKNIFVCIKQVPDTETRFKLNSDYRSFDSSTIKWIINPYDEYAIEEAIKVKSTLSDAQTIALCLGPKKRTVEALRTALAMGIEEAIAIDCGNDLLDHRSVAQALATVIKQEGEAYLVFCGKLSIDDNAGVVPQMIAATLEWNHVTIATEAKWAQGSACILRELEGGTKETVEVQLPAVISCNKGLNTPRYPSLPGIMKAKKKVIKEIDIQSLGLDIESYSLSSYSYPPERPAPRILSGDIDSQVDELVRLLREDAKVL
jgi:electron transfer flavoprotein beta subunit